MSEEKSVKKMPDYELTFISPGSDGKDHFTKIGVLFENKDGQSHSGPAIGTPGRYLLRPLSERLKEIKEERPTGEKEKGRDQVSSERER